MRHRRSSARYDRPMSPQRRDADGRPQTAHSWESLVERQIREAMDAGAFEDLPFRGQRLPIEDDSAAGEWAMAHRMLKSAGAAPPWIESDKEARRLLAVLAAMLERAPARIDAGAGSPPARLSGDRPGSEPGDRTGQCRGADRPPASPAARREGGGRTAGARLRRLRATLAPAVGGRRSAVRPRTAPRPRRRTRRCGDRRRRRSWPAT